jgi:transcriptional regulator with GAF, ATPase, and Fis domain
MRRAAYLSSGDVVGVTDLNMFEDEVWVDAADEGAVDGDELFVAGGLKASTEAFQRRYCQRLLASVDGNVAKAAVLAKYSARGLSILLERLGIER